ncbi:MAG: hypothetical protein AAB605_02480 [Patescibacteria group bacterium]
MEKIELADVFVGSHYHQVWLTGEESVESIAALDTAEALAAFNANRPEWNNISTRDVATCRVVLGLPTPDLTEEEVENIRFNHRFQRRVRLLGAEYKERPVERLVIRGDHAGFVARILGGAFLPFGSLANIDPADVVAAAGYDYAALGRLFAALAPGDGPFDRASDVEINTAIHPARLTLVTPTSGTRIVVECTESWWYTITVELGGSSYRAAQIMASWQEAGVALNCDVIHVEPVSAAS